MLFANSLNLALLRYRNRSIKYKHRLSNFVEIKFYEFYLDLQRMRKIDNVVHILIRYLSSIRLNFSFHLANLEKSESL